MAKAAKRGVRLTAGPPVTVLTTTTGASSPPSAVDPVRDRVVRTRRTLIDLIMYRHTLATVPRIVGPAARRIAFRTCAPLVVQTAATSAAIAPRTTSARRGTVVSAELVRLGAVAAPTARGVGGVTTARAIRPVAPVRISSVLRPTHTAKPADTAASFRHPEGEARGQGRSPGC